ncbi:MAG TPA: prepilin-type N-terminal cleavage/methylation domain-containing protein, partial [Fimbriimonas sp.]
MSRRGFTLTEMTVVIALLSLFAAAIVPNLASQQAGLARRAMYADIQKIVLTARDTAIESNRRVVLRYDDAERAL